MPQAKYLAGMKLDYPGNSIGAYSKNDHPIRGGTSTLKDARGRCQWWIDLVFFEVPIAH
jgi:hypothetical protein